MPFILENEKSPYISMRKLKILKLEKRGLFGRGPCNISVNIGGHLHEFCENREFTKINASGPKHPTLT